MKIISAEAVRSTSTRTAGLLRSGVFLSVAGFLTGLGNYAFQSIMGRQLERAEYGYLNSTLSFIGLLGLPLVIATTAVTHYIAHFRASDDQARLRGLLRGCRRFLFHLTIGGSMLAAILIKPLSDFFHFPRPGLMLIALVCVLANLWGSFVTALCQGMAWFKRLAFIGLAAMGLRLAFGWISTLKYPVAEVAVFATAFALLANFILLYWRKDLFWPGEPISPWDREFVQFLLAGVACMGGNYCFSQSDLLVAQRYFSGTELGTYSAAGLLARALPMVVGPLLTVLFTSRSGEQTGTVVREQMRLLGLYAAGLIVGALSLLVLREFFVKLIFGKPTPEAADMVVRLAPTMVFVGLLQALAMWALASHWLKISFLYGGLGLVYWGALLCFGKSPQQLLLTMPAAAFLALGVLFLTWLGAMRWRKPNEQS